MTEEQELLLECYIRCGFDKDKAIDTYNLLQTLNTTITNHYTRLENVNTFGIAAECKNGIEEAKKENMPYYMVGELCDGFRLVRQSNKFNYIDENENLVSDIWFDYIEDIEDDFTVVTVNGKGYNILNTERKIISPNLWFDEHAIGFSEGFMAFKIKDKGNFVDKKGNILFPDQWYDDVSNFYNGRSSVTLNDELLI